MTSAAPDDLESPFKLQCKENTVDKMRALSQLNEALDRQNGLPFAFLVPVGNICSAIVTKNRPDFITAMGDLRASITRKKSSLALQDLSAIAEINFLEGFDSFISYIYAGPAEPVAEDDLEVEEENDIISLHSSPHNSPVRVNRRPVAAKVEQVPKKLDVSTEEKNKPLRRSSRRGAAPAMLDDGDEEAEKDKPSTKSSGRGTAPPTLDGDDEEEAETVTPRRSIRSQIYDGEFNCVFNGCSAVFNSAGALTHHAEECAYKADLQLVFRCSNCKRSFPSDKAVKAHIGNYLSKCPSATIKIDSEKILGEKSGDEKVKGVSARGSSNARRKSQDSSIGGGNNTTSQVVECPFKECTYSNDSFELIYAHVKYAHKEYTLTFTCLKCGITRASGSAMTNHIDQCPGAKVELKLSKKDQERPSSMATPTKTTGKRGGPPVMSSTKKRSKKEAEVEVEVEAADVPAVEMIETDNDEDMAAIGDENHEEERGLPKVKREYEESDDGSSAI